MREKQAKLARFGVFVFATALVALSLSGQQTTHTRTSLVTDWSSRHLIFSTPTTAAKFAEVSQDPRFQQQWLRRNMHPAPPTDGEETSGGSEMRTGAGAEDAASISAGAPGGGGSWGGGLGGGRTNGNLKKDWATSLGPTASVGADEYPAKFSFDSTTASCANDFVVFGTGTAGAAAGASASATGTFSGVPTNGQTATLTYGSGAVDTVTATAATDASTTGTFSGAPTSGQTLVIHNGANTATFTAEDNTAATGTVTVAGSFCVNPGQGVTIGGQAVTTNATAGSGTIIISRDPNGNFGTGITAVTVGSVVYTFVTGTPNTGSVNAVQVHYITTGGSAAVDEATAAQNLRAAIDGVQSQCVINPCFSTAGVANPVGTALQTTNTVTVTAPCAGAFAAPVFMDNAGASIATAWTVGDDGTTSGTNFALATSGVPTNATIATQLASAVNTNTAATTVSASSSTNMVNLKANTWGTVGNSTTLAQNATSGVAVSGATLSGGANAVVSGNQFRIDNNDTDEAAALAAVIVSGGSAAGVTGSSAGAVVTITATAAGTGGNSITATETMTGFTVISPLAGGADLNASTGFFAVSDAAGVAISTTSIAANFATAVGAEGTASGVPVTASSGGTTTVTVTATAAAPGSLGNGVALTETLSNFSWNGNANLSGGVGQASIVAYKNLYSSCGGTVPSTNWAYFTGGTIQTSPALSLDGTQVAFVQTTAGVANLVLLKWAAASSTAGSPVTLTTSTAAAYRACVAPCMLTLPFNGAHNDTNSSVYYDYTSDVIYVGDDNGALHKFTSMFNGGTPAEFTTAPWPVALTNSGGRQTTSPVFAINNGIYIGSGSTSDFSTTGGYLYRIDPTTGALTASAQIAVEPGIVDAPIVDPSAGEVYAFVGDDNTGGCGGGFTPCSGVFQFATAFASGAAGTEKQVGNGALFSTIPMFTGDFDNTYFNSADPPTGSLYVCGNVAGNARIYRVPIASNTMGTPVTGPILMSGNATCSPITEADNGTADLIFVNVQDNGSLGSCGGNGCVMSFTVTSGTLPSGTAPTSSLAQNGGTSGIIIDTLGSGTAGANQVYFSPLGTGQVCPSGAGCAVQASQAGLN